MHVWDSEQLWLKACAYMERSRKAVPNEGTELLWASLALELLARSALTSVHPVLNADPQDEGTHILFALGFDSKKQPKSIPAHAVFSRLERIFPAYKPHRAICDYLASLRNEELHSGAIPFESLLEQAWLPAFYAACICLCGFINQDISELLASASTHALELVEAAATEVRSEVKARIAAHRSAFLALSSDQQAKAKSVGQFFTKHSPRKEKCPACEGDALLDGDVTKEARPVFENDQVHVDRHYAVKSLQCQVCELTLTSIAECAAANVRPRFVVTAITDLHELHEDEQEEEYDNM